MNRCPRWLAVAVLGCLVGLAPADPGDNQAKDRFRLTDDEQRLLELTNQERKKQDVPPLRPNPVLFKVARAHSANMARQEKMAHELDGKNPYQRIKEAGYAYYTAGENVANGDVGVEEIMKAWMASPKHRDNILNAKFTEIGLGLSRNDKGVVYYTQVFGTPKKKQ
jgi:uncharacterized protein YkwD